MSTPPNSASAAVLMPSMVSCLEMSPSCTIASAPSSRASFAVVSASSRLECALTTTFAPRPANSRMMARPMLRPDPVTNAVLPLRSCSTAVPSDDVLFGQASDLGRRQAEQFAVDVFVVLAVHGRAAIGASADVCRRPVQLHRYLGQRP